MSARPPLPPTHPADTSTLEPGTDMQSVPENPLSQSAFICGEVSYRPGDGQMVVIRPGPVSVEIGTHDVTLGWQDESSRLSAVMPRTEYARFIGEGAIKPVVTHRPEDASAPEDGAH
ncbi:hypothetical protein [Roseateles amylovorans]|uniref:DUF2158 domain-containing protein n=1 Tax=Roseateles amylovorans TaxID=2978473 RepID=A0ABY6B565_9BURK|nr:hypothetical protein [Roseateles amylovorans]UXH80518.1 hypothetical protein N4261_11870 [Roseateles amylovorans]